MNFDGNLLFGLILAPLFIIELINNPDTFTIENCLKSNLSILLVTIAINSFSYAMKYGKGGSVQAIENMKNVVQTLLGALLGGDVPTTLEILGLISGFVGVMIIILNKKKQ